MITTITTARSNDARPAPHVGLAAEAVAEFAAAMSAYKETSGRMFPTWSEVLEVLRGLGYSHARDGSSPATARLPFRIRIDREGMPAQEIEADLRGRGGLSLRPPSGPVYGFACEARRDSALDAIRKAHGWTSVERDDERGLRATAPVPDDLVADVSRWPSSFGKRQRQAGLGGVIE